jgi:uncharacterized tellurite resistance protein B-like protein
MMDAKVARALVLAGVAGLDGEISEAETSKAYELLCAELGPSGAQAAMTDAVELCQKSGFTEALGMAVATLGVAYPSSADRVQIVRQCVMVAGADGLHPGESQVIATFMDMWGVSEADFDTLDPKLARAFVLMTCMGIDGADDREARQAALTMMAHVGLDGSDVFARAAALMREHGAVEAFQLAIQSLSAAYPSHEARVQIVRECVEAAGADGWISKDEAAPICILLNTWGIEPQEVGR